MAETAIVRGLNPGDRAFRKLDGFMKEVSVRGLKDLIADNINTSSASKFL
jgi:hypothetical protein